MAELPAVRKARVNLSTRRVSIVWDTTKDGQQTDPRSFLTAILKRTGYESHLFSAEAEGDDELKAQLLRGVALTGFAAANIMLLSVSVWSGAEAATRDLFHWISAFIAAPALIYGGRFFYQSAWNALKHGRTNMDVPIALAISLSYAVSLWETINHGEHAWFDATASLLFFLLIGRTLDHIMRDRARSAIVGLHACLRVGRWSFRGMVLESIAHWMRSCLEIASPSRWGIGCRWMALFVRATAMWTGPSSTVSLILARSGPVPVYRLVR